MLELESLELLESTALSLSLLLLLSLVLELLSLVLVTGSGSLTVTYVNELFQSFDFLLVPSYY